MFSALEKIVTDPHAGLKKKRGTVWIFFEKFVLYLSFCLWTTIGVRIASGPIRFQLFIGNVYVCREDVCNCRSNRDKWKMILWNVFDTFIIVLIKESWRFGVNTLARISSVLFSDCNCSLVIFVVFLDITIICDNFQWRYRSIKYEISSHRSVISVT